MRRRRASRAALALLAALGCIGIARGEDLDLADRLPKSDGDDIDALIADLRRDAARACGDAADADCAKARVAADLSRLAERVLVEKGLAPERAVPVEAEAVAVEAEAVAVGAGAVAVEAEEATAVVVVETEKEAVVEATARPAPCRGVTPKCGGCGRVVSPKFATDAECATLAATSRAASSFLYHVHNKTTMVIDAKAPEPALAVARAIGQRASVFIKETFGLGAAPKLAATLLTRTAATSPPGAPGVVDGKRYWNWHVDKVNRDAYDYSALVYLGDQGAEFDGGNLEFVDDFVRPRRGLLAAFSSGEESEHRVSRVTRGARYALALWYSCDDDPETAVRARFG